VYSCISIRQFFFCPAFSVLPSMLSISPFILAVWLPPESGGHQTPCRQVVALRIRHPQHHPICGWQKRMATTGWPAFCFIVITDFSVCLCQGYKYAGIQNGWECWCGQSYGRYGASDECTASCAGDENILCGGGWANIVMATGESTFCVQLDFRCYIRSLLKWGKAAFYNWPKHA